MKILLVDVGHIDVDWLYSYMHRWGVDDISITHCSNLADCTAHVESLPEDAPMNVVLIGQDVPDILSPAALSIFVDKLPFVPIIILATGKTLHYECVRVPHSNTYYLKTDVSTDTFLQHIRNVVAEVANEADMRAKK